MFEKGAIMDQVIEQLGSKRAFRPIYTHDVCPRNSKLFFCTEVAATFKQVQKPSTSRWKISLKSHRNRAWSTRSLYKLTSIKTWARQGATTKMCAFANMPEEKPLNNSPAKNLLTDKFQVLLVLHEVFTFISRGFLTDWRAKIIEKFVGFFVLWNIQ